LLPFVAPALILFSIFVLWPIASSIALSFHSWDGIGDRVFVGLDNYRELATDPVFRTAFLNSLIWVVGFLIAPVLGLGLALLLTQPVAGVRLWRSLFFIPFVISQAVIGVIFGWLFNIHFGLLAEISRAVGFDPWPLLEDERTATFAVIVAGLWPQSAYCMVIYLAGLAAIDAEQVEAARLDGASRISLFRFIIAPQLKPATLIAVLVSLVSALRSFDLVAMMTNGGPYNASTVLAYTMYEQTLFAFRYGYGAAIACVLFLLTLGCIAGLLVRAFGSRVA
jgi:multiple sugar transport system permease protein